MARKRAPGAGRKPRGEFRGNTRQLTFRVRPELRSALEGLAKRNNRSLAQEIQRGLNDWVRRYDEPALHIAALSHAVNLLGGIVENATGKRWIEDPFTGEALRHAVNTLVLHFAPMTDGAANIPPVVQHAANRMPEPGRDQYLTPSGLGQMQAFSVITQIENAPSEEKAPPGFSRPDEWGFWQILRDLGSGWQRNRKLTNKEPMR